MFLNVYLKILQWIQSVKGATAIEYSLLIAGIAIILTVAAFLMGDEVEVVLDDLVAGMQQ